MTKNKKLGVMSCPICGNEIRVKKGMNKCRWCKRLFMLFPSLKKHEMHKVNISKPELAPYELEILDEYEIGLSKFAGI